MKYIASLAAGCTALLGLAACSDSDFTERYDDPSKTSTVTCEKLMTGVFKTADDYTSPRYYRLWTFDNGLIGRYAQTTGFTNGDGRYVAGDSYISDRWDNFYKVLAQYRVLEKTFDDLPETEQYDYEVFKTLSRIHLYDHMQQLIDMWGDIPYSEAGYLGITGDVQSAYPHYDKATVLYQTMLDDLKAINSQLAGMTNLSSLTSTYLTAQDYINGGDLLRWRKYANSLRLRMAMRVADQGELASQGKAAVSEILSDAATYPLVETADDFIHTSADEDGFKFKDDIRNGFETSYRGYASDQMIRTLTGDPRLDILYEKNAEGLYAGLNTREDYGVQQPLLERPLAQGGSYYSPVDSATISRNEEYPGIIFMPSETAFLKAEAYQKGYAGGDAEAAFIRGVELAVDFCYDLNAVGTYRPVVERPSDADIQAYAKTLWSGASDKQEVILTQKWVSFGFFQPVQAWADIRRTGIPALYFATDASSSICQEIPSRLRYPTTERDNNPYYSEMTGVDTYYNKVFWAK